MPSKLNPRKRPTLPPSLPGSTIGAERLNFSVRNGKRCDPYAITSEEILVLNGANHVQFIYSLTVDYLVKHFCVVK